MSDVQSIKAAPPSAAPAAAKKKGEGRWIAYLVVPAVLIAIAAFIVPPPAGVTPAGWHLLGLLIPLIAIWATEAMPIGASSLLFLALVVSTGIAPAEVAFKGFTASLPWLLVGAFAIGIAMDQSGLARRVTYFLMSRIRGVWSMIGAAYASNVFLVGVPSATARGAILAPILDGILQSLGRPRDSKLSLLLTYNFAASTQIVLTVMFLTGGAGSILTNAVYGQLTGHYLTWLQWVAIMFLPTIVMCGISFIGSAIFAWPEPDLAAKLRNVTAAKEAYEALGPITANEWKVVGIFVFVLVLWIIGGTIKLDPGYAALFAMALLFLPRVGVLKPHAFHEINWDITILVATAVGMAGILNQSGIVHTISDAIISPMLNPLAEFGVPGIIIGAILIGLLAHFIMPSPGQLSLVIPLLVAWGTQTAHLPQAQVLAFLGLLSTAGNEAVLLAYQKPPLYVFLGLDLTNNRSFNALLIKVYPFTAVGMFFAALIAYAIIRITGFGIS
ncbi:anion permease [Microbacteriaceae bacterium K1510]|nr:anion permease [Microbacteriaceae bacterium K1510]